MDVPSGEGRHVQLRGFTASWSALHAQVGTGSNATVKQAEGTGWND